MNDIIFSKRTTFVRAGGRHFRYSVYSIFKKNRISYIGYGKSKNYMDAVNKSLVNSIFNLGLVLSTKKTIPFRVHSKVCKTNLNLIPCNSSRGIIASNIIRVVLKHTNIKNIYVKIIGSRNKVNVLKALILALKNFIK
ncbi:hypothetical protein ACWNYH_00775 [Candidatus Vidania fulgoroideorum]